MPNHLLRSLPSIERLLERPLALQLSETRGRERVRDWLREITDEIREEVRSQNSEVRSRRAPEHSDSLTPDSLLLDVERRLEERAVATARPSLRRVINATGVILHTNLGRAPLARQAVEALSETGSHYSNLEYDLNRGERGRREAHCQDLLTRLTGSEAAVVANNNAAAVLLVVNTLAEGGEVIVSRGELIEIGGSFRIPDVMEKSGAVLREVGTTNRTRIADYERAINERTRLILRVHPSNYRIIGFTERPTAREVAELARRANLPSFEDLGSGCLIDLTPYGVTDEPVVAESLAAGISVVSFSGDKMLGGPQAGIIAGSSEIIARVRKNPLMRALRVDKATYAALEATLRLYEQGVAREEVPVIRAIATSREELAQRASSFADAIARVSSARFNTSLEESSSVLGGGSAPEVKLPTVVLLLEQSGVSAATLEERLRRYDVPIITRTGRDRVMIDLRTVELDEEAIILDAIAALSRETPVEISAQTGAV